MHCRAEPSAKGIGSIFEQLERFGRFPDQLSHGFAFGNRLARERPPRLSAFWFPAGAPDPCAPPCIRHRLLPCTAGERHALPLRVLAPHRGLPIIGPVLRG